MDANSRKLSRDIVAKLPCELRKYARNLIEVSSISHDLSTFSPSTINSWSLPGKEIAEKVIYKLIPTKERIEPSKIRRQPRLRSFNLSFQEIHGPVILSASARSPTSASEAHHNGFRCLSIVRLLVESS
jgi:hypothetical protein